MDEKIKVAIAEDHVLLRESLISLLNEFKQTEMLWGVNNGKELLDQLKVSRPDIVLLDIDMPVMNGHEALNLIRRDYPDIKVIMLSMHFEYSYIKEFINMGACAFLSKNCRIEKLIEAIHTVHTEGKYYDDEINKMLLSSKIKNDVPVPKYIPIKVVFTDREMKILELLRSNKSNKEIADILCISLRTLERNRADLMQKTGCKNLASLLAYAIENELIQAKPSRFYENFFTSLRNKLKSKVA